ncbi:MAG: fructosamine kinase family protein [Usitatibacter sp.]
MTEEHFGHALGKAIGEATGKPFTVTATRPVGGGCIHTSLEVTGKSAGAEQRYFAKVNDAGHAPLFEAEADGLAALAAAGALRVPRVISQGSSAEHSWLVLEWLDLAPLTAASAAHLGAGLAAQHGLPQERFGWARDNFIGASPQRNGWSEDWHAFWRDRRLHAQLRLAAGKRLPSRLIDRGERLAADCHELLRGHVAAKSLLHGDLWSGNASALGPSRSVVFDPAVYVGDPDADVAMTELFGGFPPDFLAAYRAARPAGTGYSVRRDLYNLYHVLNHANLFAGGYVRQAAESIDRLLAEIA